MFFINGHDKQHKMLRQLNILCHSYLFIKQFYHMSGVRVLTVKRVASGDRVQCSFLNRRSLSKHSRELLSLIYL